MKLRKTISGKAFFGLLFTLLILSSCNKVEPSAPFVPIPSENQMRWQEMEYYAFLQFFAKLTPISR